MSNHTKGFQVFALCITWLAPVTTAGVAIVAVISYVRSEEPPVAGGAPLYGKAVQEAVDGLKNPGVKPVAAARPQLPAGLSPDDYYWCEPCKAYHKRQPGQDQPAGVPTPPVAGNQAAKAAAEPAGAIPPLPAGLSPDDYDWCTHCKTYHKRQAAQPLPAEAGAPRLVGAAAAAQPDGPIPPLPTGLVAADYYWCTNCKAYHPRQPATGGPPDGVPYRLEHPPTPPAPDTPGGPAPAAPAAPTAPAAPGGAPTASPVSGGQADSRGMPSE